MSARQKRAFFVKRVRGNNWRCGKADYARWGAALGGMRISERELDHQSLLRLFSLNTMR